MDSGLIGAVPAELLERPENTGCGQLKRFEQSFRCAENPDGTVSIGNLRIGETE